MADDTFSLVPTGASTPGLTHVEVVNPAPKKAAPKPGTKKTPTAAEAIKAGNEAVKKAAALPKATADKAAAPKKATATPAKATPAPKAAAKTTPAAPAKKAAEPAKKAAGASRPKLPNNLRTPQVRILAVLAKANSPLTRGEIREKAGEQPSVLDTAWMSTWIGPNDEDARKLSDEKYGVTSLLTSKFVKVVKPVEGKKGTVYEITAAGRAALERANAAIKEAGK
jgi:hypothetical protein